MKVVLDTNVVVSGLLTETGPPARVVDLVLASEVTLALDARVEAEYREVLSRKELDVDRDDRDRFLESLRDAERVIAAPLAFRSPDPDDDAFLEVAVAGAVDALVTGNTRHFRLVEGRLAIPVVTPRRFLDLLAGRRTPSR